MSKSHTVRPYIDPTIVVALIGVGGDLLDQVTHEVGSRAK
jgi:hypothetical protein